MGLMFLRAAHLHFLCCDRWAETTNHVISIYQLKATNQHNFVKKETFSYFREENHLNIKNWISKNQVSKQNRAYYMTPDASVALLFINLYMYSMLSAYL